MRSLFHSHAPEPAPVVEPIATVFPKIEGANIAAVFVGKRLAGDFYDSVRVSPERVLFALLDVAGRREDNRGILAASQDIFRNFGTELFSRPDINESDAMTELCIRINRVILEISNGVHSCPAFIACYHERFGTLCYSNAGHTPGLLRDNNGISELSSNGLPLGLFSHATSEAPTVGLDKGAAVLLVSRGVIECEGHARHASEEFGLERIKLLYETAPADTASVLCASVLKSVADFSGDSPACDDRTALALVRTA